MATATANTITLRGSTEIVTEFFGYSINNILYQRGIYPPDSFSKVSKYGLGMMVSTDEGLTKYLGQVLTQLSSWLLEGSVQKLVVVITSAESGEVLERWGFDIEADKDLGPGGVARPKSEKEITTEIQGISRQITASVSFLPLLQEACTFDLLVYTDNEVSVPQAWEESDPKYITGQSEEVRLRSFTTTVHKVDTMVAYRKTD
eukprot:TRINITY_DN15688_c0_g1_i1.p1 TRINITY_DN15688_c0_g1~~TRINITY_DN15688_c0_g1_i1.p1  ORF type:complete len:218 (+),score=25.60 TRINITY_DN15688_c0_g1_i1:46-654(+)